MSEIYVVGGAVRDVLLGLEPKDIDYCVVGSSPEEMINNGFTPIEASSFPVFHDKDHNEYALARKERKVGFGYHGFECDYDSSITLKEDLFRRDISMNSMAVHIDKWELFKSTKCQMFLIDPFNGYDSIKSKRIIHTSKYFTDDPVRAIRVVRLAARYNFKISYDTKKLIKSMAKSDSLSHLTPERIWLEITKVIDDKTSIAHFFHECIKVCILHEILPWFNNTQIDIDFEQIGKYSKSNIIDDELAFASIFKNNSLECIEQLSIDLKIPKRFYNTFKIIKYLGMFFNTNNEPSDIVRCLDYCANNMSFNKSLEYFNNLEHEHIIACSNLTIYNARIHSIGFQNLEWKQQTELKGKDIGTAIFELKVDILTGFIRYT